jgi:4-amino-4-deoxy-L-arabinose transferase-like glycosyltransferase
MINTIEKYPVLSLLTFVILMLGFTIDAVPVSIMEARNFISAREMLTDNNWILTTMNGEPRYQKPPLPTWITAAFGFVFGMKSVLALRWPALLCVALVGIGAQALSRRLGFTKSASLVNGFIAVTSFYVIAITIEAPWDIYTHGFMLISIVYLFKMLTERAVSLKNSVLFIFFMACSVLSKGPISLYALFLPFAFAYGFTYKFKGNLGFFLKLILLLVTGILFGGFWFLYVRYADPSTFLEIASKETSNWSSYNVRPFYYYWSFFAQSGLWSVLALVSLIYPYLKHRVRDKKAYTFTFLWTVIAVVLLSIIPEKKSRYLMPVLIPLALNIGFYMEYLWRSFKTMTSKQERFPVYFQFGLVAVLGLLFWISAFFIKGITADGFLLRFVFISILLFTIGVFLILNLKKRNIKNTFYLTVAFMLCLGLVGVPLVESQKQEDYKPLSSLSDEDVKLYTLHYIAPEMIYNYGNKIPSIKTEQGFAFPNESDFNLLTIGNDTTDLEALSERYTIEHKETFDLNFSSKEASGYKGRLVNQLYYLKRKRSVD